VGAASSSALGWVLALYVVITFAYSWSLKRIPLLDVLVLAGLYTLRLIAGTAATGVEYSDWLLAFSMFFFLNLAMVKRYQEVAVLPPAPSGAEKHQNVVRGRGYVAEDAPLLMQLGIASGYLSVLVLALYVSSDKVRQLYTHPYLFLLICPLFLYWISRVWLLTHRGEMSDDPVLFAIRDRASYVVGALALATMWLAT